MRTNPLSPPRNVKTMTNIWENFLEEGEAPKYDRFADAGHLIESGEKKVAMERMERLKKAQKTGQTIVDVKDAIPGVGRTPMVAGNAIQAGGGNCGKAAIGHKVYHS